MNDKTRRLTLEEEKFKALECREMARRAADPSHAVNHMQNAQRYAGRFCHFSATLVWFEISASLG